MSVIVSVYSEKAFKEFVLPVSVNVETVLSVRKDVFDLQDNLDLGLENLDGDWFFTPSRQYQITPPGEAVEEGERLFLRHGVYYQMLTSAGQQLALMVRIEERRLGGYHKYQLGNQPAVIGTSPKCAFRYSFLYQGREYISQNHASVGLDEDGMLLTDLSKNGVFVNDVRVKGNCRLHFGDRIDIWGLNLVCLGRILAVRDCEALETDVSQLRVGDVPASRHEPKKKGVLYYHRSPRKLGHLEKGTISIEQPPSLPQEEEMPLFMTVGPALTMALPMVAGSLLAVVGAGSSSLYMYTGLVTAILSAIVGAIWAVVNVRYAREQYRKRATRRFEAYSDYLLRTTEEIRKKYEHNSLVLAEIYPSVEECLTKCGQGEHLWERNFNHADFLTYRLGLGDCPFQVKIEIPPEKFDLADDTLREKPRLIQEEYRMLHNVPSCVDLRKERIVGLVGGPSQAGARALVHLLVAQIAAQNCYTDVKLAFVYHEDQGDDPVNWGFCRWLPHVWSQDKRSRYVAANKAEASDVFYELARVLRSRSEALSASHTQQAELPRPWYILVVEDLAFLENELITKYLFDTSQNLGITTLLLADSPEELPNACECVIRCDSQFTGMYHLRTEDEAQGQVKLDSVDPARLESFARYLSNVEVNEAETGGDIPSAVTFFDLYGISRLSELLVEERWRKNRTYENMRALIGFKAGNTPCYLDIHEKYHGPHGLVAGTTGSGKSETLQTYILSLALSFSPYDVGFFLIDYKGGGMAHLFDGLPHMMGQISNLSGSQIQRAMVSIKSENIRRQRIFNDNGVNNINLYTTLYKNGEAEIPVPHLFIVIDEFAELKREQPDFMRELISVAQVGRSLGVHLILATQKPSGTVDDNIWSNSKFRLCLRVQDRQDSMDMLHKPDAAYLTQAGRAYLQVGSDEVYEQFQSGWSGAVYDEDSLTGKQVIARLLSDTGKAALTGGYIKRRQKEQARLQWLDQLLDCLDRAMAEGEDASEDTLCQRMYRILEEEHIPYAESAYNTRALCNLIQLSAQIPETGEDRAAAVAALAAQSNVKLPESKEKTQLDAVVDYLASKAEELGYEPLPPLWLPPLPSEFQLQDLEAWRAETFDGKDWPVLGKRWELRALVGECDDPANQAKLPMELNFTRGGHHALLGAGASGKSTFVQTLIYSLIHRYTPEYLNIYALDFSSRMTAPFEKEAHIGGIFYESDLAQIGKLFYLLQSMIQERRQLFRGGSYDQYVMVHGVTCPAVLVIIDNMANFREKTGEAYDDAIMRISREGQGCGIYLFLTGGGYGISEIPSRLADNLKTSFSLEMTEPFQYAEALRGPKPSILPEPGVHGRGLFDREGIVLEFQTALSMQAQDDFTRAQEIERECKRLNAAWKGAPARQVPRIPEKPVWGDLAGHPEMAAQLANPTRLPIGYDYQTAGIYSIDLSRTFCYTVMGRKRTGKTNALKLILRSAAAKGAHLAVIESSGSSLKSEAKKLHAEYITTMEETADFVKRIGEEFGERHKQKRALSAQGVEEEELFTRIAEKELWMVVISDLTDLCQLVYSDEGRGRNLNGALENLVGNGFMNYIYFAAGWNPDQWGTASGRPLFDLFVHEKAGMHLGGNAAGQQLFEFPDLSFRELNAVEKPGIGLVPPAGQEGTRRIVLPLAKG